MQKHFSKLILIFIIPIFLAACSDCEDCTSFPTSTPTLHPSAVAPMKTIAAWNATCSAGQETVQVLGKTATVASYTLTPTETPIPPTSTITPILPPKVEEIKEQLNKKIVDKLKDAFGISSAISSVEFTPITGDNPHVNFVIKMTCNGNGDENLYCTSTQVFVDLVNACKDSDDNKIADLIPERTEIMQLQIMHPNNGDIPLVFFDVNWSDVQSYTNGTISAEDFKDRVRILTP